MHAPKPFLAAAFGLALSFAVATPVQSAARQAPTSNPPSRHVQLIHLDGLRSDIFQAMIDSDRLPHFQFLLSRGRIAYNTATVDKSETFKVIQSYLTSRLDTEVVGWWQFDRSSFRFRNFWYQPADVMSYALGLEFPLAPTIQDYLRDRGENLVAGMTLARRGVAFENYGRAYIEGAQAIFNHGYYNQADATMRHYLDIHERIARSTDERTPALSTLLLAAADESAHYEGVTTSPSVREHCFDRDEEGVDPTVFRLLDEDEARAGGGYLEELESRYFTQVDHSLLSRAHQRLCVALPLVEEPREPSSPAARAAGATNRRAAHPDYVMALTLLDIEMGYLIEGLRSIRFDPRGRRSFQAPSNNLRFMNANASENSLFERTLFIIFGDHGMVDTHRMTSVAGPESNPFRAPGSLNTTFLDSLNDALDLESGDDLDDVRSDAELGINYQMMPDVLAKPFRHTAWQSADMQRRTRAGIQWAQEFFEELSVALRANLHEQYWWLFFMRSLLVDPQVDETLARVSNPAIDVLADLYLRGDRVYLESEAQARHDFFDRSVRLVYGGGARNNAELFLPSCNEGAPRRCTWDRRPSYQQITTYRGGSGSEETLLEVLANHPAVGLIFIREENDQIQSGRELPATLHIRVTDHSANSGRITVWRDEESGQLLFRYRVDDDSADDPLHYGELGRGAGTVGTYREWNDRSAAPGSDHYYHNAVAGIGSYLYSTNPAIGDVLALHREGWSFGDNAAGHGGIHRKEKNTLLLISGPGVGSGPLRARSRYRTREDGSVVEDTTGSHYPSLLDVAPTALAWLGHREGALEAFARDGFEEYLDAWNRAQRRDILSNLGGNDAIEQALEEAGFTDLRIEQFSTRLERLLQFVSVSGSEVTLPPASEARIGLDGRPLMLGSETEP